MTDTALHSFFENLNRFQKEIDDLAQGQDRLMLQVSKIKQKIADSAQFYTACNLGENSLKSKINELNRSLQDTFIHWEQELKAAEPMKALSEQFQDKIIFLIFGKVNAGKSSFCNQVIRLYEELFPNESVQRFYIDPESGEKKLHNGDFAEGFTETTVLIQGVELGKHFVLLDTPGLHSEVVKNGELTQRFLDSADAVLWLTPSTSPGQVQELDDLKVELEKGKPLLPVITRSDKIEEDWDDEKQDFVSLYLDKDPDNRKLQEDDVKARLGEFDGVRLNEVKMPISISVFTYKQHNDLEKSGFMRLFNQMAALIDEAGKYKGSKANKQVENFIRTHIITKLDELQNSHISPLKAEATQALKDLADSQSSIENSVRLSVFGKLPQIVIKHKITRNKDDVIKDVGEIINQTLNQELSNKLSRFVKHIEKTSVNLESDNIKNGYKPMTIDREEITGSGWKSAGAAVGSVGTAWAGAAIGSMIMPGVGTLVGGALGGLLGGTAGSKMGEFFVETKTVTEEVGLSTENMENDLKTELGKKIQEIVAKVIEETRNQIKPLESVCDNLHNNIQSIKQSVGKS